MCHGRCLPYRLRPTHNSYRTRTGAITMKVTAANATVQTTGVARERERIGHVTSQDGTVIGYRKFGHGPAIVVLHGSNVSGQDYTQLAEQLADAFTVYLPDRRGRGLSGPFGNDYGMRK